MDSPLRWVGGKSKLADRIVSLIPPHRQYGEAFAGAGWVFFRKEPSRVESLNDINSDLVGFYRVLQHHLEEFCRQFKWLLSSREWFEDFQRQQQAGGLTDIQRAARFYYLQRHCFGGKVTGQTFGVSPDNPPPINLLRIEEELSAVHLRLAGVKIEHLDWREYLRRYDGPETFFFLDPPYFGSEDYYGKGLFARSDYAELAGILAGLKARFLLTLNDAPEIRETFAAFRQREARTRYSVARDETMAAGEILIMNYDLRPGLLGVD